MRANGGWCRQASGGIFGAIFLSLAAMTAVGDVYWRGPNWSGSDDFSNGNNWWGGSGPASGENVYFNNTEARTWPYNNNDWREYANVISYNGGGQIRIRGLSFKANVIENNNNGADFRIYTANVSSRPSTALYVNSYGSGGVIFALNDGAETGTLYIEDTAYLRATYVLRLGCVIAGGGGQPGHVYIENAAGSVFFQGGANANTYTGNTTVTNGWLILWKNDGVNAIAGGTVTLRNAGSLRLDNPNQIQDAVPLVLDAGSTFSLNNNGERVGSVTGAGSVSLGSAYLQAGNAGNQTYSGVMSGTGGFTKKGSGILTFDGSGKTYAGQTTVDEGTLRLGAAGQIADTSPVWVASGATFDLNNCDETVQSIEGTGAVTLGSAQLIVDHSANKTFAGVISGTGAFVKKGSGQLTLAGANTYGGSTYAVGGTLLYSANQGGGYNGTIYLGETSGSDVATVSILANAPVTVSNPIEVRSGGTGARQMSHGGPLGATFSGAVTMYTNLEIVAQSGIGSMQVNGDIDTNGKDLTLNNDEDLSIGGIIYDSGALVKEGVGTATLTDVNTYAGETDINAGTLKVEGDITASSKIYVGNGQAGYANLDAELQLDAVDMDRPMQVNVSQGTGVRTIRAAAAGGAAVLSGQLDLDEDLNLTASAGSSLTVSGNVDMDHSGNNMLFVSNANAVALGGALWSGSGACKVEKRGTGTLTLSGNSSGENFQLNIHQGTVSLGSDSNLGTCYADKINFADNNATLRVTGDVGPAGPAALGMTVNGVTATYDVATGKTFTVSGAIANGAGAGSVAKNGAGAMVLNGTNTYTGATAVNAGTLTVNGRAIAGSMVTVNPGARLSGRGEVAPVTVLGSVAPGASVGTLTVTSADWGTNGVYEWEINDFNGTFGGGSNSNGWDRLTVNGALTITATTNNPFTIRIVTLSGQAPGQAANFDRTRGCTQNIASAGSIVGFATNKFSIDDSGFQNEMGGRWNVDLGSGVIRLVFSPTFDRGDAPSPYPTLTANAGAGHMNGGPMLGLLRDAENDGQPTAAADGDDTNGSDDEDGVAFVGTIRAGQVQATATVSVANAPSGAKLDAWLDFNNDGCWGGAEDRIACGRPVTNGVNAITFAVPSGVRGTNICARFRLSSAGKLGPRGTTTDGEVEDYRVLLASPAVGPGTFGAQSIINPNAAGADCVYAADVDSDGDMDVLSASCNDDTIAWYANDGSGRFTATNVITTAADGANSVCAVDVDGDGDVDVLSASYLDGKIAWYENDGSQNFTAHTVTTAANGAESVLAADVDSDGDVDVLSASYLDGKIVWYANDGSGIFTTNVVTTIAPGVQSVSAADLNGDGDMDVLSGSSDSGGHNQVAWYENDGGGGFTAHLIATNIYDTTMSVCAADMDGDGDLDVVNARYHYRDVPWYKNDGAGHFTTNYISLGHTARSVYVADMDGDGDMDVLAASEWDDEVAWYANDGNGNIVATNVITGGVDGPRSVYAADMDGDGDLDVLSASVNDSTIAWYEQTAVPASSTRGRTLFSIK